MRIFLPRARRLAFVAAGAIGTACASAAAAGSSAMASSRMDADTHSCGEAVVNARLRRQVTTPRRYAPGLQFKILRVPQYVFGVDIGHIMVLVANPDGGAMASMGFYGQSYRSGMPILPDAGVLVTPDPLYLKAMRDPALEARIAVLSEGELSVTQADQLNAWADGQSGGGLEVTKFVTSSAEHREVGVAHLQAEQYTVLGAFLDGTENCATWVEHYLPGCITCPLGIARLCYAQRPHAPASRSDSSVE